MAATTKPSVLITGCSGGIGAALAREFQSKGYIVFATARRPEVIQELSKLRNVHVLAFDVCDEQTIKAARDRVSEVTGGKLDVLFNNAGMYAAGPAAELDITETRKIFETNLFGIMITVKEFTPLVIAAKGRIISVSSLAGVVNLTFSSTYNATKAALFAYSDALRLELAPFGVKVSAVAAGAVTTAMYEGQAISIPSDSIYAPVAEGVEKSVRARTQISTVMTADAFAKQVVKQTMSNSPPRWIWAGTGAYAISWIRVFIPQNLLDHIVNNAFGKLIDWSLVGNPQKTD